MVKAARSSNAKFQLGPNDNLFDFTYVGNIAHAHLLAAVVLLATSTMNITPLDNEKVEDVKEMWLTTVATVLRLS